VWVSGASFPLLDQISWSSKISSIFFFCCC